MKTQAKNPFTVKDLKEAIRHQKHVIENLKGNLQIMIATVEALRAEYDLSVEAVHDITMAFVAKSAHVNENGEGTLDASDILGAGPQIQEQMAKLKETIAANSTTQTPE